jgi:transposase
MNRTATSTYCVDLAKNKFQVHEFSAMGECLRRRTMGRGKFDQYFFGAIRQQGLVVMEACAGSHYWGRRFEQSGYRVKLVPPQFVARQRMGNKTDGNDADGIFAVHGDPRVRPVPVKSVAQQDVCAQHRVRDMLIKQRTQCINQARGLLAERGYVAPRGEKGFDELLRRAACRPTDEMTPQMSRLIEHIRVHLCFLEQQIAELDHSLADVVRQSAVAQRIDSIHGIGTITASAIFAEFGAGVARFSDSRQFAANIGATPREHSSGERRQLGAITKRGNAYIRRLLVQGAQSVVNACHRRDDDVSLFARRLLERRPRNTVVVAVANRLARITYAVIKNAEPYRPKRLAQAAA